MESLHILEITWTQFIQNLGGWLLYPMRAFTFLGNEEFYMLIMPLLYWCVDATLGLRVGIMLLASGSLNGTAKLLLRSPRPYWIDKNVIAYISESSFGLPSGHSMNSMSVWGLMAASIKKKLGWVIAGIIIFMVGLSRIYLGVHFTTDVLLGWTLGAILLVLFLRLEKRVGKWVSKQSFGKIVLVAFLISLAIIALNAAIIQANTNWQIPSTWMETAQLTAPEAEIHPFALSGTITNAAVFFGLACGAAWMHQRGGFSTEGSFLQRSLRFLIGLAGVVALWAGLGQLFPHTDTLLGFSLRYVRYALTGGWISAGAPYIFQKLSLAPVVKEKKK